MKIIMRNLFYFLLFTVILSSCEETYDSVGWPGPDVFLEISLVNSENVDLLDPNNPEGFDHAGIGYYYIENGQEFTMYNSGGDGYISDIPKGFTIYKRDSLFVICPKYHRASTGYNEYLFKWDAENSDTVKCEYKGEAVTRISKIWHNQTIVWDEALPVSDNNHRIFKIVRP